MNEIKPYKLTVMRSSTPELDGDVKANRFSLRGAMFFGIGMLMGYFFIGF